MQIKTTVRHYHIPVRMTHMGGKGVDEDVGEKRTLGKCL